MVIFQEEPQPSDELCAEQLREDLPVKILYCKEALSGPAIIFRFIRDYLQLNGLEYHRHPKSSRVIMGLPEMFYVDEKDRTAAVQAATNSIAEHSGGGDANQDASANGQNIRHNGNRNPYAESNRQFLYGNRQ